MGIGIFNREIRNGDIVKGRKDLTSEVTVFPRNHLYFALDVEGDVDFVTIESITRIGCMVGVPKRYLRVCRIRSFLHRHGIKKWKSGFHRSLERRNVTSNT